MNIQDFQKLKDKQEPISVVTCYDYWSACLINQSPIHAILVGDSASMVMHGSSNTLSATVSMMCSHVQAVSKGAPEKFIIADMPFLAHRKGLRFAMNSAQRLMQAGAHAIKLEGAQGHLKIVQHMVQSGIPVMGHLGLTPQSIFQLGGYRIQGREETAANQILQQSKWIQEAGCFSLVLECVPEQLARKISDSLTIPTIGIGAGIATHGQVLVLQDMLGMNAQFNPKFVRKFLDGSQLISQALVAYHQAVQNRSFPSASESFE